MIDGYVGDMTHIIEPYKNIKWDKYDREKLLNGQGFNGAYFGGKYGFVDTCILETMVRTAGSYINTHSKKYYAPSFSQTRLNEKKALAKWLNDVFYPYINKLDVRDNQYDMVKHNLEKIKEAMVIK